MRRCMVFGCALATLASTSTLACPSGTFPVDLDAFAAHMSAAGQPVEIDRSCYAAMPGCPVAVIGSRDVL